MFSLLFIVIIIFYIWKIYSRVLIFLNCISIIYLYDYSIYLPDHMEIINYRESNYQNVLDSRERFNHHSKSLLTGRSISEYQKKILKYISQVIPEFIFHPNAYMMYTLRTKNRFLCKLQTKSSKNTWLYVDKSKICWLKKKC